MLLFATSLVLASCGGDNLKFPGSEPTPTPVATTTPTPAF
jgi:hypothetical protein